MKLQLYASLTFIILTSLGCGEEKTDNIYVSTSKLDNSFWKLDSYANKGAENKNVLISTAYTLNFKGETIGVYVQTDCETTRSPYSSDDETLEIKETLKETKKCTLAPSLVYQKQHKFILDALNNTSSYILDANSLTLLTKDETKLNYTKITTDKTATNELQELKPFQSDGCSIFPDGTLFEQNLWLKCCDAHDYSYWKGGTYEQKESADKELETCVSKVGEPEVAAFMLLGVTVGGSPLFPTPYRWGYGWPYPKGYGELSETELTQVEELSALHLP